MTMETPIATSIYLGHSLQTTGLSMDSLESLGFQRVKICQHHENPWELMIVYDCI